MFSFIHFISPPEKIIQNVSDNARNALHSVRNLAFEGRLKLGGRAVFFNSEANRLKILHSKQNNNPYFMTITMTHHSRET